MVKARPRCQTHKIWYPLASLSPIADVWPMLGNITAGGEVIGNLAGGRYFLKDHVGSVRTTVDRNGNIVGRDDYYPFGLTMPWRSSNSSNPNDDYKFTGYEKDDEAGLTVYHAGARGYDPVLGRFMQIDPHHFNYPGISSYAYVGNNPLIYSDPTGKDWYLNLQQGRVVWFDGSDDRYDDGFVNIGELNGLDNTSIGDITDRLDELGYEYGMSAEEGLAVDTEGRYKAWAMEQIFSPENVGLILALGQAGSVEASRHQGSSLFEQMSTRSPQNIKTTAHGAERVAGATRGGVLSPSEISVTRFFGQKLTQANGAIVRIHQVGERYNVVVEGSRGVITTFKNISQKSLERLGKNYGWK